MIQRKRNKNEIPMYVYMNVHTGHTTVYTDKAQGGGNGVQNNGCLQGAAQVTGGGTPMLRCELVSALL